MEPERIELFYAVNPITGKRYTKRWKMTEAAAAKYFEGEGYEILWGDERGTQGRRRYVRRLDFAFLCGSAGWEVVTAPCAMSSAA